MLYKDISIHLTLIYYTANKLYNFLKKYMMLTAKEILFSSIFPGLFLDKITIFQDKVYKVIKSRYVQKPYI